jgi:hypothetical protein
LEKKRWTGPWQLPQLSNMGLRFRSKSLPPSGWLPLSRAAGACACGKALQKPFNTVAKTVHTVAKPLKHLTSHNSHSADLRWGAVPIAFGRFGKRMLALILYMRPYPYFNLLQGLNLCNSL